MCGNPFWHSVQMRQGSLLSEGHQAEMQQGPDGQGENADGSEAIPGPGKVVGLNGEKRDHEIIAEPGVPKEREVLGVFSAYAAEQGHGSQGEHQRGDREVNGQHRAVVHLRNAWSSRPEIRVDPLCCRPQETEAGLDRSPEIALRGSQLVQQQREIEWYDAPHQSRVLKRGGDQFAKGG